MEEQNKPLTNPELQAAVERMNRDGTRESREAVLDTVITSARFLAPVTITPAPGKDTADKDAQIQFQLLANQEDKLFFPAFTNWDELRKLCGPKNQQTVMLGFDHYAGMVLKDKRAAGFVVDPFGCCLSFDRDMISHLVQRKTLSAPPQ